MDQFRLGRGGVLMYNKNENKTVSKVYDITRYFEGVDLSNSALLSELPKLTADNEVEIFTDRYDLLAKKVYGDARYSWILLMYSGISEKNLKDYLGDRLLYPSLSSVMNLIINLDEYC